WSGAAGSPRQVVLRSQVGQTPNPPPGFCQAAGELACTVRSVQPHWPFGSAGWGGCTETQRVPEVSVTGAVRVTSKTPSLSTYGWAVLLETSGPGSPPKSEERRVG